jgi:putative nucleotidyltransferase with HDIG domain
MEYSAVFQQHIAPPDVCKGANRMPKPTENSLHRTLVTRIGVTALILAVLFAILGVVIELAHVQRTIESRAEQRIAQFEDHATDMQSPPAADDRARLGRLFDELLETRIRDTFGILAAARLYDREGGTIRDFADADAAAQQSEPPATDARRKRLYSRFEWNDGRPYIKLALRLNNRAGQPVAYIDALFAVSAEQVEAMRSKAIRVASSVLIVTLLTAALLYPVILNLLRRLSLYARHLLDSNLETLKLLGDAIAKRDSDTNSHNYRVTLLAVQLAERLGCDRRQIQALIKGAFLHDVGKIAISDTILLKPGRLDEQEFSVMKTHVLHGLDIIKGSPWLEEARDVVGHHHEKCDGSGYPDGRQRTDIPINARIFAIADVFDALTSERPYKQPYSFEETMRILEEGRGSHFDPDVLDAFRDIAPSIYAALSGREDAQLEQELEQVTRDYFSAQSDALA